MSHTVEDGKMVKDEDGDRESNEGDDDEEESACPCLADCVKATFAGCLDPLVLEVCVLCCC